MADRRPGAVPDDEPVGRRLRRTPVVGAVALGAGADLDGGAERDPAVFDPAVFDTDGDGLADTLVTADGVDLVLRSDLDGDGLVDQELRIGPDAVAREAAHPLGDPALDGLLGDPQP